MVKTLPDLPRRIEPTQFFMRHSLELLDAIKPEPSLNLISPLSVELELESNPQAVFTYSIAQNGQIELQNSRASTAPILSLVIDQATFKALYQVLLRWVKHRQKQNDLAQFHGWLHERLISFERQLPQLLELIAAHPASFDLVFSDELVQEHVISLELGSPQEQHAFLRIAFSLEDVPLDAHMQSTSALQALARSKIRISGDSDYLSHFTSFVL